MGNTYKIHPLFPLPLYTTMFEGDFSSYQSILQSKSLEPSPEFVSKEYGSKSDDVYILHDPELTSLASWIMSHFQHYATKILNVEVGQLGFSQSWISQKSTDELHAPHHHSNSVFSGVLYFEDKKDIEPINFMNPNVIQHYQPNYFFLPRTAEDQNIFNYQQISYNPVFKELIIFPSWLKHGVEANKSSTPRKSLAINTFFNKGAIGDKHNLTELDISKLYTPPLYEKY